MSIIFLENSTILNLKEDIFKKFYVVYYELIMHETLFFMDTCNRYGKTFF